MYEIEFIGRGGQGAKTAAEIVARSAIKKGLYVQSFPDYGPERKGAPVRAFTRTSREPIRGCSSEANPDVIVVIDTALLSLNGTLFKLNDNQTLIVNTAESPNALKRHLNFNGKLFTVDASKIALQYLKSNITNTTMLAALSKACDYFTLDELKKEIEEEFGKKISPEMLKNNLLAAEHAYDEVKC
ncbi:TPA: pyruvate synthase [Candidatus Woesearchaeota archaeon]|nr:2-oxoacid:acceptor oxidoreductase family protein [Candidatus Woesearchaeota archaeon]HIH32037.1 pyruvate synthase [Candidatus Woesearchaeota archaeon]HIH54980.1 pyruvate synthase [Candidatus Woesearchaeota archaeon]HIJ01637.1 pyruvate synthase [Candidatus Woesearchaeota archaeon]HIJ13370.1 pyruvate synthase [Candidatus Woesearchaeota archaeon]